MALKDDFISELKHEAAMTRKLLEKVPMDKKEWKPHEKSMTLGRLATHIAETINWASNIIRIDDFDFMARPLPRHTVATQEELLNILQTNLDTAIKDISEMSDDDFNKKWTVRAGHHVVAEQPKKTAIRGWAFSHQYHHRGQLSVYLRLLDVPVPGMYGPSADER